MGHVLGLALALILAVGSFSGCGGGTENDSGTKGASGAKPPSSGPGSFPPNGVAIYGHEAKPAERQQAAKVIEAWMRARAAADWAEDCNYFSKQFRKALVIDAHSVSDGRVKNCPQALAYFGPLASGDRVNTLTGPIDSLRVEGGQGYALYHGRNGVDWTVSMNKDAGKWKVSVSTPVERD